MAPSTLVSHRRWWLLGGGAVLGLLTAFLAPGTTGCVYHDTCIKVTFGRATQWLDFTYTFVP